MTYVYVYICYMAKRERKKKNLKKLTGEHMRRTTVYLTSHQLRLLQKMSSETGVPVAEYIRRGVNHEITAAGY